MRVRVEVLGRCGNSRKHDGELRLAQVGCGERGLVIHRGLQGKEIEEDGISSRGTKMYQRV